MVWLVAVPLVVRLVEAYIAPRSRCEVCAFGRTSAREGGRRWRWLPCTPVQPPRADGGTSRTRTRRPVA